MKKLMLIIAIGYPLGLIALAIGVMRQDAKLIFNEYYMAGTLAILPAFLMSLVVVIARSDQAPKLIWSTLLGLWVLLVTAGHLYGISFMARNF